MNNPNGKIRGVHMIVIDPGGFKHIDELIRGFPYSYEYLKPIEDLGYTIEEVYEVLTSPYPMQAYLKISQTVWEQKEE